LQKVKTELEAANAARVELETALSRVEAEREHVVKEQHVRYTELETELQSLRTELEERRAADEQTANLALELEKEKGRLAGRYSLSCCFQLAYLRGF
jgi:hypothetical protein